MNENKIRESQILEKLITQNRSMHFANIRHTYFMYFIKRRLLSIVYLIKLWPTQRTHNLLLVWSAAWCGGPHLDSYPTFHSGMGDPTDRNDQHFVNLHRFKKIPKLFFSWKDFLAIGKVLNIEKHTVPNRWAFLWNVFMSSSGKYRTNNAKTKQH